ncbi:MAG: oxidoreductase [Conexivisphaerales archaeon]
MKPERTKPKLAIALGATCSGCDYSLLDLGAGLLDVTDQVEIVYWPTGIDSKLEDLQAVPDRGVDLILFDGAVVNEDNLEMARLCRKKAKMLAAFGSCGAYGGIPGLINSGSPKKILLEVYQGLPTRSDKAEALNFEGEDALPKMLGQAYSLDQVVDVDVYLPGCPPPLKLVAGLLTDVLAGKAIPKGTFYASNRAVCYECKRVKENKSIDAIHRYHEIQPDPTRCLLEQGIVCLGPATRGGCDAVCCTQNQPCRGCMGALPHSEDSGAEMMSALASIMELNNENKEADYTGIFDGLNDPLGTFYTFTLPKSILGRRKVDQS